ncbi:hypothetical protein RCL1_000982 [Eukaryota sp. TZLM3-RCL]
MSFCNSSYADHHQCNTPANLTQQCEQSQLSSPSVLPPLTRNFSSSFSTLLSLDPWSLVNNSGLPSFDFSHRPRTVWDDILLSIPSVSTSFIQTTKWRRSIRKSHACECSSSTSSNVPTSPLTPKCFSLLSALEPIFTKVLNKYQDKFNNIITAVMKVSPPPWEIDYSEEELIISRIQFLFSRALFEKVPLLFVHNNLEYFIKSCIDSIKSNMGSLPVLLVCPSNQIYEVSNNLTKYLAKNFVFDENLDDLKDFLSDFSSSFVIISVVLFAKYHKIISQFSKFSFLIFEFSSLIECPLLFEISQILQSNLLLSRSKRILSVSTIPDLSTCKNLTSIFSIFSLLFSELSSGLKKTNQMDQLIAEILVQSDENLPQNLSLKFENFVSVFNRLAFRIFLAHSESQSNLIEISTEGTSINHSFLTGTSEDTTPQEIFVELFNQLNDLYSPKISSQIFGSNFCISFSIFSRFSDIISNFYSEILTSPLISLTTQLINFLPFFKKFLFSLSKTDSTQRIPPLLINQLFLDDNLLILKSILSVICVENFISKFEQKRVGSIIVLDPKFPWFVNEIYVPKLQILDHVSFRSVENFKFQSSYFHSRLLPTISNFCCKFSKIVICFPNTEILQNFERYFLFEFNHLYQVFSPCHHLTLSDFKSFISKFQEIRSKHRFPLLFLTHRQYHVLSDSIKFDCTLFIGKDLFYSKTLSNSPNIYQIISNFENEFLTSKQNNLAIELTDMTINYSPQNLQNLSFILESVEDNFLLKKLSNSNESNLIDLELIFAPKFRKLDSTPLNFEPISLPNFAPNFSNYLQNLNNLGIEYDVITEDSYDYSYSKSLINAPLELPRGSDDVAPFFPPSLVPPPSSLKLSSFSLLPFTEPPRESRTRSKSVTKQVEEPNVIPKERRRKRLKSVTSSGSTVEPEKKRRPSIKKTARELLPTKPFYEPLDDFYLLSLSNLNYPTHVITELFSLKTGKSGITQEEISSRINFLYSEAGVDQRSQASGVGTLFLASLPQIISDSYQFHGLPSLPPFESEPFLNILSGKLKDYVPVSSDHLRQISAPVTPHSSWGFISSTQVPTNLGAISVQAIESSRQKTPRERKPVVKQPENLQKKIRKG